ncbi:hypothetical protein [Priestia aryabhattai]|uniref:hypothetical protein n=1 Tax=Priestia aryabhattai TaxID=412384 RepID=UPI003D28E68B
MVEKAVLENVQDLVNLRILLMKELGELNGNEELFQKATEEYFTANINNPNSYTAILKHLMQYGQKSGVNRIWLNASSAGKSLYQKHGFIEYGSEMEYKFEKK